MIVWLTTAYSPTQLASGASTQSLDSPFDLYNGFFPFFTVPPYTTRGRFEAIHSRGVNWVTNLPGFAKWTLWYLPMLCFRAHKSWSSVQVLCSCDGCIKTGCRMHYCIGSPWFPIFRLPLPDACGGSSVGHVWWFVAANIPYNNWTSHRSTPAA